MSRSATPFHSGCICFAFLHCVFSAASGWLVSRSASPFHTGCKVWGVNLIDAASSWAAKKEVQKVKPLSTQGLPCQSDRSARYVTSMIEQTVLDLSNPLKSFHRSTYGLWPLKTIKTNGRTTQKTMKNHWCHWCPRKNHTIPSLGKNDHRSALNSAILLQVWFSFQNYI